MAKSHRRDRTAPPEAPPGDSAHEAVVGGLTIGRPAALGLTIARWEELFAVGLVVFLLLVFLTQSYGTSRNPGSWNDQSRLATMQALVEHGTFAIDYTRWGWWTGDKVFVGEHFYSTKPPVLSALAAAVYWPLYHGFGMEYGSDVHAGTIYYLVTLILIGLPLALTAVLFYAALADFGLALRWRLTGVGSLVFASLYLPYSTIFQNHTVAGLSGFLAFWMFVRTSRELGKASTNLLLAGFGVSFALATDIVGGAPFALAALCWLVSRMVLEKRGAADLGWFIAGALPILIAHLSANYLITGDLRPIYSKAETYRLTNVKGLFGEVLERKGYLATLFDPYRWRYVLNSTIGIRGVLLYTPTLIFGLWMAWRLLGKRWNDLFTLPEGAWRSLAAWTGGFLAMTLISWIYLCLRTENYGGTSYASRYFIAPMSVLLFFAAMVHGPLGSPRARGWYAEALRFSLVMAVVGLFFPWGVLPPEGSSLVPTNFSFVMNLEVYAYNLFMVLLQGMGAG